MVMAKTVIEHFGRHVQRASCERGVTCARNQPSHSEVDHLRKTPEKGRQNKTTNAKRADLGAAVVVKHDVLGLEVAVANDFAAMMQERKHGRDLPTHLQSLLLTR